MIVNYSLQQAIESCHHARKLGLSSVLVWRSSVNFGRPVLLVIPFSSSLHYGIFDATQIRRIDL